MTGASRGLGRALAERFGASGHRVVVNYCQSADAAEQTVREIVAAGGAARPWQTDVSDTQAVTEMVEGIQADWGHVDILVSNAGIAKDDLVLRTTEEDWDRVVAVDLKGAFNCLRAVAPSMTERRTGHILNIASLVGARGGVGQGAYAAAKAGLIGLTRTAAQELGPYNVKVNALMPGFLPTSITEPAGEEALSRACQENVLGRASTVQEVADFAVFLCGTENISGQVFALDSRIHGWP